MNITLNIGLNVSKNYLPDGVEQMQWNYHSVKEHLQKEFGKPSCIRMAQSATEETIVVQYNNVEAVLQALYQIAQDLQQDCIAYSVQDDNGVTIGGALVGKYAHAWNYGVFNEEYFINATIQLK